MIGTRIGAFLLLSAVATAQHTVPQKSTNSEMTPPKLPVIDFKACPSKTGFTPRRKLAHDVNIYSSWKDHRVLIRKLKAGMMLTVLAGVNVIREPDRAELTQGGVDDLKQRGISAKQGDVVLRYGLDAGGDWTFWANGVWYTESYEGELHKVDSCGFTDSTQCTYMINKDGIKEWWIKVRIKDNTIGWVLASKSARGSSASGDFSDMCILD